jgi:hypothetical protein
MLLEFAGIGILHNDLAKPNSIPYLLRLGETQFGITAIQIADSLFIYALVSEDTWTQFDGGLFQLFHRYGLVLLEQASLNYCSE